MFVLLVVMVYYCGRLLGLDLPCRFCVSLISRWLAWPVASVYLRFGLWFWYCVCTLIVLWSILFVLNVCLRAYVLFDLVVRCYCLV